MTEEKDGLSCVFFPFQFVFLTIQISKKWGGKKKKDKHQEMVICAAVMQALISWLPEALLLYVL